ncbi:MAG: hypothetical protein JSR64_02600, partial [Nitrospira sp.]|nr:hypothetical protein [Nitrospira sp.]
AYGLRTEDVYFSGTPELAIGQGSNKGIVLEFDPAGWVGKVSKEKPGWETSWGLGQAEYTARPAPGVDTKNSLRAFTVKPDAIGDKVNKMVLKRTIESLIAKGWTKTVQDDGAIRMERPPTMRDSLEQAIKTIGG